MLRVEAIRARPLDLPLRRPVETAAARLTTTPLVLVDVVTSDGVTGCAYASVYSPLVTGPLAHLIENLAELVAGTSAEPAAVEEVLARHFKLLGRPGLTGIALATIDMALWDARAKVAALPTTTQATRASPRRSARRSSSARTGGAQPTWRRASPPARRSTSCSTP